MDSTNTIIGPCKPFTGVNQDIFIFEEMDKVDNIPVMKYSCERARKIGRTR